jgi:hypothetical protein
MSTINKKRGRKRKEENIQMIIKESEAEAEAEHDVVVTVESEAESGAGAEHELDTTSEAVPSDTPILKKRGRKPKGGKLINKNMIEVEQATVSANVILHLKCSLKDIQGCESKNDPLAYNPTVPPEIMSYDDNKCGFSFYGTTNKTTDETEIIPDNKLAYMDTCCKKCNCSIIDTREQSNDEEDKISLKDINSKLKDLRIQFYKNTLNDKKSACFWCSYEFDNQPCYIPKYEMDDAICGYGSFCRPECAVGYLMRENIDDSTKFERYQLLNQIYSKVYNYKKNIKPAPNPYYLLEKFYGTLTIQEYRKLLKTEHMLLVIDKPLTKILPELHDDNDEFILNIYGGVKTTASTGGVYKVKRQSEKTQGPTKNSIIKDKFGVS